MPEGWQCARYRVPRDYSRPGGAMLTLFLARLPARDPRKRKGSVFFNPGGPGGGGVEAASYWEDYVGASVRRRYDLVTWDPRGVIRSRPRLRCLPTEQAVAAQSAPGAVLTRREMLIRLTATAAIGRGCRTKPLAPFITSMDNVRDLDRLRRAVGDRRLSYVGISYGTVIGALYANVHPTRYRVLVLHGVVDSTTWFRPSFAFATDDGVLLENTLRAALVACDRSGRGCALAPHAVSKYRVLLRFIRANALTRRNSEHFTGLWATAQALVQGSPAAARAAAATLQAAYEELLLRRQAVSPTLLAEARKPHRPIVRTSPSAGELNFGDVRDATICSDAGLMPRRHSAWVAAALRADRLATTFGAASVLDRSVCAGWRSHGDTYTGGWNHGARPVLLLNQVWDHATPHAWARTMTRRLGRAKLLTLTGWGHGVQTPCGRTAVDAYLTTGRLPTAPFCPDGKALFPR
ncbi:alpha/beta hydrolase [Actinocorallia longicatena]|uniref:Alpha/beta hydrolase n=2 Tax=Actinocorallia longicatena TaxID=111803 RepID=A0ABP6QCY1_9ACTN